MCTTLSGVNEKTDRFLRRTEGGWSVTPLTEEEGGGRQQPSLHVVIKRRRRQARDRARALRNRNPKAARVIIYSSRGASLLEWRDDSLSSLSPRTIPFLRGEKGSRSKALPVSFRSSRDWPAKCLLEREEGEYFVDFKRVKIEMIKFLRTVLLIFSVLGKALLISCLRGKFVMVMRDTYSRVHIQERERERKKTKDSAVFMQMRHLVREIVSSPSRNLNKKRELTVCNYTYLDIVELNFKTRGIFFCRVVRGNYH